MVGACSRVFKGKFALLPFLEAIHGRDERHKLAVAHNLAFQLGTQFPVVGEVKHDAAAQIHSKPVFLPTIGFPVQHADTHKGIDLEEGVAIDVLMEISVDVPRFYFIFLEVVVETAHHIKTVINVI